MSLKSLDIQREVKPTLQDAPINYGSAIIDNLGILQGSSKTLPSELYLLIGLAHSNIMRVATDENYSAEKTIGFFAQLGTWYEQQPDKELARQRLLQSEVVFYDGKKIGLTNEENGRDVGDTIIAAHHRSFGTYSSQVRDYTTMNCAIGGDEGFALIIPYNPNQSLNLVRIRQEIDEQTKIQVKRWLKDKIPAHVFPDRFWQKNWYSAKLKDIGLTQDLTRLHRPADGAVVIEMLVDAVHKDKSNTAPNPEATATLLDNLIERGLHTIFADNPNRGNHPYQSRGLRLPQHIIDLKDKLVVALESYQIDPHKQSFIDILAERSPFSELFAKQGILEKSEFVQVLGNTLIIKDGPLLTSNSLEHALKKSAESPLDQDYHQRRWQLVITSSRHSKQANTESRLKGTEELLMTADAINQTLASFSSATSDTTHSCTGKFGGSFATMIFASDQEADQIIQKIYQQEIAIRNSSKGKFAAVTNPLDLHISSTVYDLKPLDPNDEYSDKKLSRYLDECFNEHYSLEVWQTLAQTNLLLQMPRFIRERWQRRLPLVTNIIFQLMLGIITSQQLTESTRMLQAARAACRGVDLVLDHHEPVLPIRNLIASNLRTSRRRKTTISH